MLLYMYNNMYHNMYNNMYNNMYPIERRGNASSFDSFQFLFYALTEQRVATVMREDRKCCALPWLHLIRSR